MLEKQVNFRTFLKKVKQNKDKKTSGTGSFESKTGKHA
jgi:hypothetical protein